MTDVTAEVLVVGAGPTGLMLANWLAKTGVDVAIVDSKSGPTRESRAVVVQARSMEIYDQLGIIDEVLAQTENVAWVAPGFEKKVFGRVPLGQLGAGVTPYPRLYVLEQSRNEALLLANLRRLGVEVQWNRSLESLEIDAPGGVLARTAGAAGEEHIRARYCVGADGSGSLVRRLRGIRFEGTTNEHVFYVCDATEVNGLADGAVNVRPGQVEFLLTFPMGSNRHHRLIGVVRAGTESEAAEVIEPAIRERIGRIFGVTWGASAWFSTYRVHHRVASAFRDGPVFLAGDAAHVHSPVGAQGMNTGLQDAHNLALKLADVMHDRASDASLDRYEAERRPVARRLIRTTDRVFVAVTSRKLVARFVRRWVFPVAATIAVRIVPRLPGASRLFEYVSQVRIHYWMSALRDGPGGPPQGPRFHGTARARGAVIGRRLPWAGDNFAPLQDAVWQVHVYGSVNPEVADRIGAELRLPVHRFRSASGSRLQAGVFYLVRPDGFVAAGAPASEAVAKFRGALPDRWPG